MTPFDRSMRIWCVLVVKQGLQATIGWSYTWFEAIEIAAKQRENGYYNLVKVRRQN